MNHLPLKLFCLDIVADVTPFPPWPGNNTLKRCSVWIVTGDTCSRADRTVDELSFAHLSMALGRGAGSTGNHFFIGERLSLQVMTILTLFFFLYGGMNEIGFKAFWWLNLF